MFYLLPLSTLRLWELVSERIIEGDTERRLAADTSCASPAFSRLTAPPASLFRNCPQMLEVKESSIPGAGRGLFAREHFATGSIVCEYTGRQLRTADALR